ncbi:hypothetical protein [Larkinella soli]|uniref:hypothetical protein n=1 Tax=Larkinella soli TaxID=1770527 RepID=UPI000FFBBCA2|nr:hypothetical protein [Larkinella soli]
MAQTPPKYKSGDKGHATSDKPNGAYNSGQGKKGSGAYSRKMKHGMSRSGNSNLQTGTTKTGQEVNDPVAGKKQSDQSTNTGNVTSTTNPASNGQAVRSSRSGTGNSKTPGGTRTGNAKGSTTGPSGPGGSRFDKAGNSKNPETAKAPNGKR